MSVSCLRELTQQLQVLLKHSFSLSNISRWLHDSQSIDRQQALTMLNIAVQSPTARWIGRVCWWNVGWQHRFFLVSLEILVPLAIATIVEHHEYTWTGYQSKPCQFLGTLALFVLLTVWIWFTLAIHGICPVRSLVCSWYVHSQFTVLRRWYWSDKSCVHATSGGAERREGGDPHPQPFLCYGTLKYVHPYLCMLVSVDYWINPPMYCRLFQNRLRYNCSSYSLPFAEVQRIPSVQQSLAWLYWYRIFAFYPSVKLTFALRTAAFS